LNLEWDYNTHVGGESLQSVVFDSNTIFNLGTTCSELAFEEIFLAME